MLLAMLSNMFLSNNISVYAFELREGDSIEDDENYANIEFGDTELDDDDDNNGVDYGDLDYDDALDILEENNTCREETSCHCKYGQKFSGIEIT